MAKTVYIPVKYEKKIKLPAGLLKEIKGKAGIVGTIQHLQELENAAKQTKGILGGQVLGCNTENALKIEKKVKCFLFIGSGKFHPLKIAMSTGKPTYYYDPLNESYGKIDQQEIAELEKRKRIGLIKYHHAQNVGIIVSTKQGQNKIELARKLASRKDKNYYLFLCDTLNLEELENFTFIESWVNTACPRITEDKTGIVNIEDVL